ncbi:hypothetical protein LOTGIDRAFT_153321 [Lottia gigantea]|uniref:Uncharacterized protein n=1 Tax=Lottia gigantea TaxID=225164 RepID=V4BXN7_LOTGI|nr:hypothetical protein LOTGIDRAFT_153321 [Lottia gigantea]ESO93849.1 hypothetical protein LOTGIDRAFT_153321 [Lottia gigantea]
MTMHQNPRSLEMTTSTVPKFPTIRNKSKEKDYRKPPKIEVAMNKRFLYKPYTMMNGDDLPELKRLEHTELADKTRSRNKMEKDRCWRDINLSFRDHQYALAGLRQEQSLVYQFMCKVQKDKRRIQRQVHKRRELEFQGKMRWERIKDMCRYVVFKFRENAQKKKQARLSFVDLKSKKQIPQQRKVIDNHSEGNTSTVMPRTVYNELAKRSQLEMIPDADGHEEQPINRYSEKSVTKIEDPEETKGSNPVKNDPGSNLIDATMIYTKSKTESDILPAKIVSTTVRSGAFETFRNGDTAKEGVNDEVDVKPEVSGIQFKSRVKAKVVQVRKDKSKQPLTKDILETDLDGNNQTKKKSPEENKSCSSNESLNLPKIHDNSTISQPLSFPPNNPVTPHKTRRTGIVKAPEVMSTDNCSDHPAKPESTVSVCYLNEPESEKDEMCNEANRKHKAERESLAMILKKRKKARAKKDLENLNRESFVKYERTKSGLLKAFPGKREDFLPPSNKHLHNRQKLLKQEHDAILRQRLKLHKFYNSVIELRDRVAVHESPPDEPKVVQDKELPILEDTLSQMTNSIFNSVPTEQPEIQDGDSTRYVRVYEKDTKEQEQSYRNNSRRMSSWNM